MKLCVTSETGDVFELDVDADTDVESLKALVEVESGVLVDHQGLSFNGMDMSDNAKTLQQYGVGSSDLVLMRRRRAVPAPAPQQAGQRATAAAAPSLGMDWGSIGIPGQPRPPAAAAAAAPAPAVAGGGGAAGGAVSREIQVLWQQLQGDAYSRSMLKQNNPPMSEALERGDFAAFVQLMQEQMGRKRQAEFEKQQAIMRLNQNPFDVEAQQKIEDLIREENVAQNLETAMEHNPEAFGQVHMLYIECKVNGVPLKAFVDSGAQMTIMNPRTAERCGLLRLLDKRWAGMAVGVGTQKILGRIHVSQLQIGDAHLAASFTVLERQNMDMLLGLDMLKRHQCCIDLRSNQLVVGTTGTAVRFLNENELPECARMKELPQELAGKDSATVAGAGAASSSSSSSSSGGGGGGGGGAATSSDAALSSDAKPAVAGETPPSSKYPEETVSNLMAITGIPREAAINALDAAGGNVEMAAGMLLG